MSAKPVWLTSVDQVKKATNESLRYALITPDGAGVKVKTAALDELLNRQAPTPLPQGFPLARQFWKPPFRYCPIGTIVVDADDAKIIDIRGWGHLCGQGAHGIKEELAEKVQDEIGERVATFLNSNWTA